MTKTTEPIAIVGISCRFPGGAVSPSIFWDHLIAGRDLVTEVSKDRWNTDYFLHPRRNEPGKSYTFAAGVLDNYKDFDAAFFGVSPREAEQMDPQQRLMLELVWEALEDGHIRPSEIAGRNVGVYVGVSAADFASSRSDDPSSANAYFMTGSALSIVSNRISYVYDLKGPSMSIDTACSSSLVAMHQACESLRRGETDMVVCGGVNILMSPHPFAGFSHASMLSPEGRCKAFDDSGRGYVRAEGGAVVLLKPLSEAVAAGDKIHAVVKGTGLNSDGRTTGIALPNTHAQEALLRRVYAAAGIPLSEVDYVEAHGTGTMAGDPQEAGAIGRAIGATRATDNPLPIGSVKTNIGHLESGAGMAGLMKSVMVLKHREVPPSLHFKIPNVNIPFDEYGLKVVTEPLVLDAGGRPLVVGINSFGFGGTNSHVVLQEYQPLTQRSPVRRRLPAKVPPVFLSARSKESLAKRATQFAEILDGAGKGTFYDVAWTASHVRDRLEHRLVVRGADAETIIDRLRAFGRDGKAEGAVAGQVVAKDPKIAFVFSGNGSQWGGMGRELLAADPIFRRAVGKVDTLFKKRAGWSIIDVLLADDIDDRLEFTEVAQPTLFALQVGLLEVLEQRGVHPAAVVGHSVGEVAAAYACGALSLSQAVRVIFERSAAQGETKGAGRMAAAGLTPEAAASAIAPFDGQVEIAAVNSPESVTLSGPLPLLEQLGKALVEKEVFYRILDLDYPFHSRAMDPIQNGLFARLKGLKPGASEVPFVSTVAGETVAGESLDATYWWENIRKPVQFGPALSHLIGLEATVFVEIGPHAIMQMYVREALRAAGKPGQPVGLLKRGDAEVERLEDGIAALHAAGAQEDLSWAFPLPGNIQDLPAYPWHRQTHWFDSTVEKQGYLHSESFHPLLGFQSETNEFMWENDLDVARLPFLSDHKVDGAVVFPAAGFVEMALAAAAQHHGDGEQMVFDLEIRRPLVLEEDSGKSVRFLLSADDGTFAIESRERLSADPWTQNVVGRFGGHVQVSGPGKDRMEPGAGGKAISATAHYDLALSLGLDYGPAFQAVSAVHVADREAFGQFTCPEAIAEDFESYFLHPSFLDGAFQMLFDILSDHIDTQDGGSYLPSRFGKLRLFQPGMAIAAARVSLRRVAPRSVVADMRLVDSDGETVADLVDCRFRRFETRRHGTKRHPLYQFRYEPTPHLGGRRASPVPPTDVIAAEVAAQLPVRISEISRDGGLESVLSLFDALAASIAFETVRGFRIPEFTLKSLMHMGRVDSAFGPQLAYLISILEEDGLLVTDGDTYRLLDGSDLPPPEEIWRLILADYPAYLPEMVLAGRCARHMPAILRGSVAPDSIVSSRAGGGTLEHYFEDSGTVRAANLAAEMVIDQIVADWPSDRRLRILEIGGGTGGLASRVIDSLPSDRCDYVFTDESDEAVGHAEAHFKDSVFVSCRTLDISQDFADQGFEEAAFDIVIVGNILHRLSDMGAALGRVRGLLAERGLLLLAERMPERLTDMIFGSKPSWWRHTEDPWHPISSLMTPDKWVELLGKAGFEAPVAVSDGAEETAGLSYLVLARGGAAQSRSATETQSRWLILSDAAGSSAEIADSAAATLRLAGHEAICARPGKPTPKQALAFDPLIPADVARLLADVGDVSGIVHLVGFANGGTGQGESVDTIMDLEDRRCGSLLHLVQALERLGGATRPQLCVATGGAQGARPVEGLPWGLVRVLMNEQPGLNSRLIDLQDQPDTGKAGRILADELRFYDGEDEVILSGDARIVPRLDDAVLPTAEGDEASLESIRLDFSQPGPLSHLSWGEVTRRPPGEGEIEIEVRATGLNFRDVMWAMGMLPDEAVENGFAGASLGMECAGVVVNVGPGVRHFRVGDEVLAFAPSCFGSHVTTATTAVAPKPSALAFEEAATIPSAFFTAYYALGHLAQLRAGEKVLIHGAAGGVGIAAIQYAAYCGAEIFATAGSDEKRDFLRMLGVDHVLDSRSLAFADEIREITGGVGIDVVLNSLAGEALVRSLDLLRPFGRFLELGKRDFFANSRIGLRPFRNNVTYYGIDADQLLVEREELAGHLFREMMGLFEQGVLRPLPHRVFRRSQTVSAFRHMQQSRHIGKIVVTFDEIERGVKRAEKPLPTFAARADGTYLITGGLGGFGLATAQWLVERGARHLILMGRSGAASETARNAVEALVAKGVTVSVVKADVADADQLRHALADAGQSLPPLRGVIHAAMVIDDGLVANLDRDRLAKVIRPKAAGAWALHEATLGADLNFFVLYSSATTYVGSPGQGNYVAANAYLESLAEFRKRQGLPALAVSWGAISDVGYLAQNEDVRDALSGRLGRNELTSDHALVLLGHLLTTDLTNVAAIELDWATLGRALPSARSPKYAVLRRRHDEHRAGDAGEGDIRALIAGLPEAEARQIVSDLVAAEVGNVLGIAPDKLNLEQPVSEMGMDSLMALELRMSIEERFAIQFPMMALTGGASINKLVDKVAAQLLEEDGPTEGQAAGATELSALAATHGAAIDVDQMGEILDEVAKSNDSGAARLIHDKAG